jgi:hypothetical protein
MRRGGAASPVVGPSNQKRRREGRRKVRCGRAAVAGKDSGAGSGPEPPGSGSRGRHADATTAGSSKAVLLVQLETHRPMCIQRCTSVSSPTTDPAQSEQAPRPKRAIKPSIRVNDPEWCN